MLKPENYTHIKVDKISPKNLFDFKAQSEYEDFILVLSYIYNDLKNLTLVYLSFSNNSPKPDLEVSSYLGEHSGLDLYLKRLMIGTVYEIIEFLIHHKKVLNNDKLEKVLSLSPKKIKSRWFDIKSVVNQSDFGQSSSFKKILSQIRSNITYHYYQSSKVLKKSYIDFFSSKEKLLAKFNDYAYFSVGENMQSTRFYYADAAGEQYIRNLFSKRIEFEKEMLSFIGDLNSVFHFIINSYIISKK